MDLVWSTDGVTVSEVWETLAGRREIARNTVHTLMDRLEKKGWLRKTVEGGSHVYRAVVDRETALGGVVNRLVDTAFAGSVEGLVLTLLESRGISDEEARAIRKMIQQKKEN